jgi:hypothetical protein
MRSNNPSGPRRTHRHGREVTRRTYRRQLSPAALTVVDLVGLKVPLDRVRVRGLLLQVGGSLRFPNRPTELQAMFGGFHRPEPWSPCLGPLAPCRLRPARPGLSGAARHQRSRYPGQPRQARSTSRAGPRHRRRSQSPLGWSRDGSVRSWVSVLAYCELQAIAGGVRLGWHRQHPCLPPSYMAGSHPAPLAADQPCSSRLVVQADRPNHHNSRGSSGVKDSAHRHRRVPAGTRARSRPPSPRLRTAPSPVPA